MKIKNKRFGFTLIELLIVITIMTILLGISAPSFSRTLREVRYKNNVATIAEMIKQARSLAFNSVETPQLSTATPVDTNYDGDTIDALPFSYAVQITKNSAQMIGRLFADYSPSTTNYLPNTDVPIDMKTMTGQTYTLTGKTDLDSITEVSGITNVVISFDVSTKKTTISYGTADPFTSLERLRIQLQDTNLSRITNLVIDSLSGTLSQF